MHAKWLKAWNSVCQKQQTAHHKQVASACLLAASQQLVNDLLLNCAASRFCCCKPIYHLTHSKQERVMVLAYFREIQQNTVLYRHTHKSASTRKTWSPAIAFYYIFSIIYHNKESMCIFDHNKEGMSIRWHICFDMCIFVIFVSGVAQQPAEGPQRAPRPQTASVAPPGRAAGRCRRRVTAAGPAACYTYFSILCHIVHIMPRPALPRGSNHGTADTAVPDQPNTCRQLLAHVGLNERKSVLQACWPTAAGLFGCRPTAPLWRLSACWPTVAGFSSCTLPRPLLAHTR